MKSHCIRVTLCGLCVAASAIVAGCEVTGNKSPASTSRDSAGVRIVDNVVSDSTLHPWTLDTSTFVHLGDDATDTLEEFSGFTYPLMLTDGRIVVASAGSNRLHVFDSSGTWLSNIGRSGSGPGEFQSLGWVGATTSDSIWTYDYSQRRFSIFASEGSFARDFTMETSDARPLVLFGDHRVLMQRGEQSVSMETKGGAFRDTVELVTYDSTAIARDRLGRFPAGEQLIIRTPKSMSAMSLPFGKSLYVANHDSLLIVGTADTPELRVLGADGVVQRIIRWNAPMAAPTTEDIEAYVKQTSSQFGVGQEFFRDAAVRDIRAAPMPKLKPAFAKVLVSTDGSIWVLRYNVLPLANSVLDVFDVSGNWQGTVKMLSGFQPTQITPGAVIGTRAAEDGVQHVLRYRMHRNY